MTNVELAEELLAIERFLRAVEESRASHRWRNTGFNVFDGYVEGPRWCMIVENKIDLALERVG